MKLTILKTIRLLHLINKEKYNEKRQIEIVKHSPLFDKKWYLSKNPDIKKHKISAAKHYVKYGWKEGRNPSPDFDNNEYLLMYPELKKKNICPLFHKERCKTTPIKKITFPRTAQNITYTSPATISPKTSKRLAIFASFSLDCKIHDYVIYYLKSLKTVADTIIFIADNPLQPNELEKITPYITHAEFKRHGEYDFGSYKRGYEYAEQHHLLQQYDELIICNDSCYGPVYPFTEVFANMSTRPCDFWGMLSNSDIRYHLQSYFYVFRKPVLQNPALGTFLRSVKKEKNFWDVVYNYEFKLTQHLQSQGFKATSYLPHILPEIEACSLKLGNRNKTVFPLSLIKNYRFPLIKVKCFTNGFGSLLQESPDSVLSYLKQKNPTLRQHILKDLKSKNLTTNSPLATKIKQAELISFDVFDTLLIRPYTQPTDLFKHLEQHHQCSGFAAERIAAETRARQKHKNKEDITINEIYEEILPKYKHFQTAELELELQTLRPHPQNKHLYTQALKAHKPIIITSDMYLPASFIQKALQKNGFTHHSKIYVSGDINKTKGTGSLFKHILKQHNLAPEKLLHIGDNEISDINVPTKLGIQTHAVPRYIETFLQHSGNQIFKHFHTQSTSAEHSVLTAMAAQRQLTTTPSSSSTYWQEIGYMLGGPLALGYTQMIIEESRLNHIDSLLFVSRDGYILQKVYNQLANTPLENHYVYAPRILNLKCFGNYCQNPSYLDKYLHLLSKEIPTITPAKTYAENQKILKKHTHLVTANQKKHQQSYQDYLRKLNIKGKHIASIDMTTGAYTSERFLKSILKDRYTLGFFSAIFQPETSLKYIPYKKEVINPTKEEGVMILMELLITAPEPSITDFINGKPVFKNLTPEDSKRITITKEIEKGILQFVKDYKNQFGTYQLHIPMSVNMDLLQSYISHLTLLDKFALENVSHAADIANENFVNIYTTISQQVI